MEIKDLIKKSIRFHGHICPGLAIGVLAAKYLLEHNFHYSPNEEIVVVVENDNCSIDALQVLLGTTYGKGNLIHNDYGKPNYYFYNRKTEKALKLSIKKRESKNKTQSKQEKVKQLMDAKPEDIFAVNEIEFNPPGLAQIEESIECDICGESTMNSRLMFYNNSSMCIPCYKTQRK